MRDKKLIWQTRDEMPAPTNPLQGLLEIMTRQSRDMAEDKLIACLYGIIVGWDDAGYKELQEKHGWSDEVVQQQKRWHESYNKAWNLYMGSPSSTEITEEPPQEKPKKYFIKFTQMPNYSSSTSVGSDIIDLPPNLLRIITIIDIIKNRNIIRSDTNVIITDIIPL